MKRSHLCLMVVAMTAMLISPISSVQAQDKSGPDKGWASLKGQVVIKGKAPVNKPENVEGNADKAVCLVDGKVPNDDTFVISKKNELANVFVIMYTGRGAEKPEAFHPSYEESKKETLVLDNEKCRFVPKAIFARTGQKIKLTNSDNVGHNCRIATMKHEHNVNIPKKGEIELTFGEDDDSVPGGVFCDMHKWMDSLIMVRDNPYVAITDAEGKFEIKNLPAGEWTFRFWHKEAGWLDTMEVKGVKVEKYSKTKIEVKADETRDLGVMTLPTEAFQK